MTSAVIILPIVARPAFHDPAWREQYTRECVARCDALHVAPPRTRPLLVIDNARTVTRDNFHGVIDAIMLAMSEEA